jgi:hypothetical protein
MRTGVNDFMRYIEANAPATQEQIDGIVKLLMQLSAAVGILAKKGVDLGHWPSKEAFEAEALKEVVMGDNKEQDE